MFIEKMAAYKKNTYEAVKESDRKHYNIEAYKDATRKNISFMDCFKLRETAK